ncbi:hypothetical protein SAMN05444169_8534 [Bradyrhizobium erythrophlei]|uniref:Uncharacterized protein n=2 Tax=Bradyrhizobium erythrophlei TaxID=1437360 RepID=A0A1M5UNB2_9BRAD|nr:hypothetical protein SAMN05444169_8534 [Bradyrhizobium erythrophlei]
MIAGRVVARYSHFDSFVRFILPIQPQTQYYPTASQLVRTTLELAPRDKILVLVGGNSVFRGTAQNQNELWTKHLQDSLGSAYSVVNLAVDQGGMESFAGVAFRILVKIYPRIIYVGTVDPRGFDRVDGLEIYKYIFWDAYYKGLFDLSPKEAEAASRERRREIRTFAGLAMHLTGFFDSLSFVSSLKNEISYRLISPDWTIDNLPYPFSARKEYKDIDDPNIGVIQQRIAGDNDRADLIVARTISAVSGILDASSEEPKVLPSVKEAVSKSFDLGFSEKDRSKIVGVFLPTNPRTLARLPERIRSGMSLQIQDASVAFVDQGYNTVVAGRNLTPTDFVDEGHLMPSGGRKLAVEIADFIGPLARHLNYLPAAAD